MNRTSPNYGHAGGKFDIYCRDALQSGGNADMPQFENSYKIRVLTYSHENGMSAFLVTSTIVP